MFSLHVDNLLAPVVQRLEQRLCRGGWGMVTPERGFQHRRNLVKGFLGNRLPDGSRERGH